MKRTARVWLPLLFALLAFVGLGLALTNTSIGPNYNVINGRPAPWFDGALLAAVSFTASTFSLCGFYFPAWERRHAVFQVDIVIGGRRVPAQVFPYSTGVSVFVACIAVMICLFAGVGNHVYLFLLGLPALVTLMRVVFGRQFVAVTPGGLAWRVMPADSAQGHKPGGAKDYLTRQPVQFLPWDSITDVSLAEVTVTIATRRGQTQTLAKMLRVSVSDQAALDALTSYQRVIPTPIGADVLLPLGWKSRYFQLGDCETRAQPEAVWEAVAHYWHCPDERCQIGSALGAARLASDAEAAPAAPPIAVVPLDAGIDPRAQAQRIGGNAVTSGQRQGGMFLGVPYFALVLLGFFSGHGLAGAAFFNVTLSYMLVIVLPGCAVISGMVAAFASAPDFERVAGQAVERGYLSEIVFLALAFFGLDVWHPFVRHLPVNRFLPPGLLAADFFLCALAAAVASRLGMRCGRAAKMTGPAWLARWLAWCGRG